MKKSRWANQMRIKLEEQLHFILPGLVVCLLALMWSKDGDLQQESHQDFSMWGFCSVLPTDRAYLDRNSDLGRQLVALKFDVSTLTAT